MKYRVLAILFAVVGVLVQVQAQAPRMTTPVSKEKSSISKGKKDSVPQPEPTAWRDILPLGERYRVPLDTLLHNFYRTDLANAYSLSYATTGNLGSPSYNNIYFERPEADLFFFKEPFHHWMRSPKNFEWYNTRLPYTQISYHTGGSGETGQDNLAATFSANVNKQIQVGGGINYVTGKGQYNHQADKEFSYRLFTSYIGDRYQIQAAFNHYDYIAAENGGITNDDFILDPAAVQGGDTKVDGRTIPTKLSQAFTHLIGHDLYLTHRYNLGYYKDVKQNEEDTVVIEEFVPVSSIVHTLTYEGASHRFVNKSAKEDLEYFRNTYLSDNGTNELSSYWAVANTVGITVHEGLSKYFPMGLGAYVTYEIRGYNQVTDTTGQGIVESPHLTPLPDYNIAARTTQHALWVGGQLWKRQGAWLTYEANARVGLADAVLGDLDITGKVGTKIPVWNDSLSIQGNVLFKNTTPSYFYKQYVSNHFIWDNDFGKTRRLRISGEISFPKTGTYIQAGFENIQNHIYFDNECMPRQESDNIQVISATIKQNFKVSIFHLDLEGTYQLSSNQQVLPLPTFSAYGNFYLLFPIAKVLHLQVGVDCNWYSAFKAPAYQPALISRYNQDEIEIGNYPFMNAYVNAKLKKARFYIMYSHMNQGWLGGNNYFSIPHYPLNPAMLQLGVSVDFAN